MYVIAYDFGNYYAQLCCIEDMDPKTRRGGTFRTLLDSSSSNVHGIPSAFFWSDKVNGGEPVFGVEAENKKPGCNCIRYMKLHMHEKITLYSQYDKDGKPMGLGRAFSYDDIITQTVQYQVRHANRELQRATGKTSNKIALTYPAIFHSGQRAHLVELVERATLEDGTHLQVVGTIMEPAAAALNYLAEQPGEQESQVAMVVDIGAGTFDLSLVEAYPNGRKDAKGNTYYYDVKWNDGSFRVAGIMFTQRLYQYALKQVPFAIRKRQEDDLLVDVEEAKRRLSDYESTIVTVSGPDEDVDIELTRSKFEELTADLMDQIIAKIQDAFNTPNLPTPDVIVITGGASRMPMVERRIKERFPNYKNKVDCHKPGEAIAQGAARYAAKEGGESKSGSSAKRAVRQCTTYAIGIRYLDTTSPDLVPYISVMVPAGTVLPFTSKKERSYVVEPTRYSRYTVMEANCKNPDPYAPDRDWREVVSARKDHGRVAPVDTPSVSQITIDENNMLFVEVTDPNKPSAPPVRAQSTNLNLTDF